MNHSPPVSGAWMAPLASAPVRGTVTPPGSKSLTNRYLVLAALADGPSRLRSPLRSRDTLLMAQGLRELGVRIEEVPGDERENGGIGSLAPARTAAPDLDWIVTPAPLQGPAHVACGLAGTVMRFLPPVAALADGPVSFDGDPRARQRPMASLLEALRYLGAGIDDHGTGSLPFTVTGEGRLPGGTVALDASVSSQFISGLLLTGARFEHGLELHHEGGPVPSEPHIRMTVEVLRDAGVIVDDAEEHVWRVEPSAIHPLDVTVEPDLSSAAPFLAAAVVTGGEVRVPGWPHHTCQAGDAMRDILDAMGAEVRLDRDGLTVRGAEVHGSTAGSPAPLNGLEVDLHDVGELVPVVAALAALADTPSHLRGVAHLRGHETDRLAALAAEISNLGGEVLETEDGLRITPHPMQGGLFRTYDDHRMAMAGALIGLIVPDLQVDDIDTTAKTLPDFAARWQALAHPEAGR